MWTNTEIDIGPLLVGQKKKVTFVYEGKMPSVTRLNATCNCTKPKQVGNSIETSLQVNSFPKHIRGADQIGIKKTVRVYFKGRYSPDILTIKANLKK